MNELKKLQDENKRLRDENRYIIDRLDSLETLLHKNNLNATDDENFACCGDCECCKCNDDEYDNNECSDNSCYVEISINVNSNDEELKEIIESELYKRAEELHRMFEGEENYNNDYIESDLEFTPIYDKTQEKMIGVIVEKTCSECGKSFVENIFTDGTMEAEQLAEDEGFRDYNFEDEFDETELEEDEVDVKINIEVECEDEEFSEFLNDIIMKKVEEIINDLDDLDEEDEKNNKLYNDCRFFKQFSEITSEVMPQVKAMFKEFEEKIPSIVANSRFKGASSQGLYPLGR